MLLVLVISFSACTKTIVLVQDEVGLQVMKRMNFDADALESLVKPFGYKVSLFLVDLETNFEQAFAEGPFANDNVELVVYSPLYLVEARLALERFPEKQHVVLGPVEPASGLIGFSYDASQAYQEMGSLLAQGLENKRYSRAQVFIDQSDRNSFQKYLDAFYVGLGDKYSRANSESIQETISFVDGGPESLPNLLGSAVDLLQNNPDKTVLFVILGQANFGAYGKTLSEFGGYLLTDARLNQAGFAFTLEARFEFDWSQAFEKFIKERLNNKAEVSLEQASINLKAKLVRF